MLLQTALSFGVNSAGIESFDRFLLGGVKILFLIGILLYLIFAIIIVRQINVMKKTLITPFEPVILTIGLTHLAFVLIVGVLFLLIL
ncbi:MAG: hypothetical protein GW942_02565 [Candidatus Pacebacteria bacterium]|nr:hypothetical protein [Candidatus Paceibacterota bacterium]